jgi:type II secretion system protein H
MNLRGPIFRRQVFGASGVVLRARGRAGAGFTLIELMVVVVLVGIMTAMIIPEMKGTYEDALLRSSGRKLLNAFSLAYSQSVTVNQPHRVRLDRKAGRYYIEKSSHETGGESGFIPLKNVPGSEGELDTRISFEVRKPEREPSTESEVGDTVEPEAPADEMPDESQGEAISFYPNGTADDLEIILKDREGFRLALRINPTTARVRIVELERRE